MFAHLSDIPMYIKIKLLISQNLHCVIETTAPRLLARKNSFIAIVVQESWLPHHVSQQ